MIKVFRKIRQRMLTENRFSKYILYAVGEIILVVIGILIALAVSDWRKELNNRETEQRLLSGLHQGIKNDIRLLEAELQKTNMALVSLKELDSLLKYELPKHDEHLNSLFGSVYGIRALNLNRALYEDLKSTGLGIVSDEKLKSQIIDVFENNYASFDGIKKNELSINQVNRPYYLSNFVSIQFSKYAVPMDIEKLWKDAYYKNIVYYRLVTLKGNQEMVYRRSIRNMNVLLELLEQNLKVGYD